MPITVKPRIPFGPKIRPARDTYAMKLAKVRKQYIAGANRRNMAAIRAGIKARQGAAPGAVVPSGTMGVPAPSESIAHALTALNEVLLDLSGNISDAAARDQEYRTIATKAFEAKDPKKKLKYHRMAAERAKMCCCDQRVERHIRAAAAQASLIDL